MVATVSPVKTAKPIQMPFWLWTRRAKASTYSCLHCLLPASRDKDLMYKLRIPRKFSAPASRTKRLQSLVNFVSLALSVIFILNLHTVHCLLCFRLFLYISVCTCLFTGLCNVIRSSDRKVSNKLLQMYKMGGLYPAPRRGSNFAEHGPAHCKV